MAGPHPKTKGLAVTAQLPPDGWTYIQAAAPHRNSWEGVFILKQSGPTCAAESLQDLTFLWANMMLKSRTVVAATVFVLNKYPMILLRAPQNIVIKSTERQTEQALPILLFPVK